MGQLSSCTETTEGHTPRACAPQQEKAANHNWSSLCLPQLEKAEVQQRRPSASKDKNKQIKKKKKRKKPCLTKEEFK